MSRKKQVTIIAAVAAVVIVILCMLGIFRVYHQYSTLSSSSQNNTQEDQYVEFEGNLLQYGKDGALYKKFDGTTLWSQSYEMQQPLCIRKGGYLCIADQGGNSVLLFNKAGLVMQTETTQQVIQAAVSENGTVALILEGDSDYTVQLLDKSGETTAKGNAHLDETGFPVSAAVSSTGQQLAVSYLDVMSGELSTKVTFYDFGTSESNANHVVSTDTYSGEAVPRLEYMDNGSLVAFGSRNIRIYKHAEKPSVSKTIKLDNEIKSIFCNGKKFGIVYLNGASGGSSSGDASEGAYEMKVYSAAGRLAFTTDFDLDYKDIRFLDNGQACILGSKSFSIVSCFGRARYTGELDEPLYGVFYGGSSRTYYLVCQDKVDRIRLE